MDDPTIIGWMHGDEPDNAQSLGQGKGYGPPIPPQKIIWNCIECTRIHNPAQKATPHQVRSEVWLSLIHGSQGLIYFVHEWAPKFDESALLSDPEMLSAVTALNRQIRELAPVLNTPSMQSAVRIAPNENRIPVAFMAKRHLGAIYLFAATLRDGATETTFRIAALRGDNPVEVLGENRSLAAKDGSFRDRFQPWDAHVYKIPAKQTD